MNGNPPDLDPHVITAIFCVLAALMVAFGLYVAHLVEKEEAKRRRRKPFDKDE